MPVNESFVYEGGATSGDGIGGGRRRHSRVHRLSQVRYGTVAINRYKTLHIVIRKYSIVLEKTEMSFKVLSSEMDLADSRLIR